VWVLKANISALKYKRLMKINLLTGCIGRYINVVLYCIMSDMVCFKFITDINMHEDSSCFQNEILFFRSN